jgi:hypothetical protein
MAKAQFHRNQRVFVKSVGTWSVVEKIVPHWTKGINEPLRIFYEVGLGREFAAEELQADESERASVASMAEQWRIIRTRNKSKSVDECMGHPYPGTHPTVVTGDSDWGGWRVPSAEYEFRPFRVEFQARMIMNAPKMAMLLRSLVNQAKIEAGNVPDEIAALAQEAAAILRHIDQDVNQ